MGAPGDSQISPAEEPSWSQMLAGPTRGGHVAPVPMAGVCGGAQGGPSLTPGPCLARPGGSGKRSHEPQPTPSAAVLPARPPAVEHLRPLAQPWAGPWLPQPPGPPPRTARAGPSTTPGVSGTELGVGGVTAPTGAQSHHKPLAGAGQAGVFPTFILKVIIEAYQSLTPLLLCELGAPAVPAEPCSGPPGPPSLGAPTSRARLRLRRAQQQA